jgi:gliding motility-associated-like protein
MKFKIIIFLIFVLFSISKIDAQIRCITYRCFECEWGGEFKVTAPNIFTPNNDEINDVWMPIVTNIACLSDIKMTIHNRWGQLVFESSVHNVGWNGTSASGSIKQPEGTYYYFLSYTNLNTKETKTTKGFLQLER